MPIGPVFAVGYLDHDKLLPDLQPEPVTPPSLQYPALMSMRAFVMG
jgi:hypothetical protein